MVQPDEEGLHERPIGDEQRDALRKLIEARQQLWASIKRQGGVEQFTTLVSVKSGRPGTGGLKDGSGNGQAHSIADAR